MKRFALALVISLCACAPKDISVRLLGAQVLDATCKSSSSTLNISQGSMNVALTTAYFAQFGAESDLQVITTTVGTDTLQGPGRNDFITDRAVYAYTSTPATAFPTEAVPMYAIIPAGASGTDSFVGANLITSTVAGSLLTKVVTGGPSLELLVSFQLQGHLFSGESLNTNTVTFPINVYSLPPSCPTGTKLTPVPGPCGNIGQDGPGFTCT